jgi:hypothetical protein
MNGEEPTLFHVLKHHKRRDAREICEIRDQQGNILTWPQDIQNALMTHLTQKYEPI